MDFTNRDDLRQMLLDIRNKKHRVPPQYKQFLAGVNQKFTKNIDLTFDESEQLVSLWDIVTEDEL